MWQISPFKRAILPSVLDVAVMARSLGECRPTRRVGKYSERGWSCAVNALIASGRANSCRVHDEVLPAADLRGPGLRHHGLGGRADDCHALVPAHASATYALKPTTYRFVFGHGSGLCFPNRHPGRRVPT